MGNYDMYPYATSEQLLQKILPSIIHQTEHMEPEELLKAMTEFRYALVLYAPVPKNRTDFHRYQDTVETYLKQRHGIHCFDFRSHHMGILSFGEKAWEVIQRETMEIEREISEYLHHMLDDGGPEINLSIGRPFRGLLNLQDSYSELINSAITFSIRPGELVVSEFDIVNDPALMGDPYPQSEIERRLADAVFHLEIRKAKMIMKDIMRYEMSTLHLKLSFLPRMSARLELILIVLHVPRNSGDEKSAEIYGYPYRVQYAEGIDHGVELIYEFFDKLDDYYSAFRFNIGKDITQITDFISSQSDDPNLSATMICDRFRISPSYLSHLFKKRTGMKLVDYIHQVRLAKAKTLLETSEQSIAEIGSQVGYISGASFATTFKKYESMTPREYREHYLRNQKWADTSEKRRKAGHNAERKITP